MEVEGVKRSLKAHKDWALNMILKAGKNNFKQRENTKGNFSITDEWEMYPELH